MSNQITKHPDLVRKEKEVKDLQKQLKKKKSTLKSLKTRLQNMQQNIEDISRKVQTQMMSQMEKLDKLRQEIAELARQLKKSKGISNEDKEALEGIAEDLSGEDLFGEAYESYKEHKERLETGDFDFDENERARMRDVFEQFQVKPPEEEQRSIRKVFLKLSQVFHPDRAKNKKEEEQFHEMMQQINEAYQQNDIHSLLEMERLYLTEELDFTSKSITIDVLDQAIERLKKEIKFIDNQVKRTSGEIKNIRNSDMGYMLTTVNKAEKEGEGFEAMDEHHKQAIDVFTKLRDGLQHSIEIDAVSPKLMEMMMGQMMGELDEDDVDIEDIMSLMNLMNENSNDGDAFDFSGLFEHEEMETPKFPIGSSVRVKSNKGHELHKKTKMKGWEGRVVAAYYEDGEAIYEVEFDSITLQQMPDTLIKIGLDEFELFDEHSFLEHQLVASQARDTKEDTFITYRRITNKIRWTYLPNKQAKRLQSILLAKPELSDFENWTNYLIQQMPFPFNAKMRGIYTDYGIPAGHPCKVLGIEFHQEDVGHIMTIQPKGVKYKVQHPLIDLIPVKASAKMKEIYNDYEEWAEEMLEISGF